MAACHIHLFVLTFKPLPGKFVGVILARLQVYTASCEKLNQSFPIESLAESWRVASSLIYFEGKYWKEKYLLTGNLH